MERDDWVVHIPSGGSPGGNLLHFAPEVRAALAHLTHGGVDVPYAKQQTFETGCIWAFIVFGEYPFNSTNALKPMSGEACDKQGYPPAFLPLLRRMLMESPDARPTLEMCVKQLRDMDELTQLRLTHDHEPERIRRAVVAALVEKETQLVQWSGGECDRIT